MSELIWLCDEHDNPLGSIDRDLVHRELATNPRYHRSVQVFVLNSGYELLSHRVSAIKGKDVGMWNVSASGHVLHPETYEQGAVREVMEENRIRVSERELQLIRKIQGGRHTGYEHAGVYFVISDQEPRMNEEADALDYFSLDDVRTTLADGSRLYTPVFRILFPMLEERLR